MSDTTYYEKLKNLTDSGRLSIRLIIAPPRANSTLVEHVVGNSKDINSECHEPFLKARYGDVDPDHGYKQIYESIGGIEFEESTGHTALVIKEMSHWIAKNREYERLVTLVTEPVVVLIRNPLLTVESRIRRVLTTLDMRYNIDLQRNLLEEIAREKGFTDWKNLANAVQDGTYEEDLDFLLEREDMERLYDIPVLTIQNRLLDLKAQRSGYSNWQDLIGHKLYVEQDYKFFESLLAVNTKRVALEKDEFKTLKEEVNYFVAHDIKHVVFDTTDLRVAPEEMFKTLCDTMNIDFSPAMLRWDSERIDFHTEQKKQSEKLWYDALLLSSRVNAPTETPPTLEAFPEFIQDYMKSENLPIYAELSMQKVLDDSLRHELNNRELEVKITSSNKEHLAELGLITQEDVIGEYKTLPLKHIDPIYAVTNEPDLQTEPNFQRFKQVYANEIEHVTGSVRDQDEHLQEVKPRIEGTRFL